jgi:hypothetical protein
LLREGKAADLMNKEQRNLLGHNMGVKAALGEEAEGGEERQAIGQIEQVGRQVIGWSRLAASVTVRVSLPRSRGCSNLNILLLYPAGRESSTGHLTPLTFSIGRRNPLHHHCLRTPVQHAD